LTGEERCRIRVRERHGFGVVCRGRHLPALGHTLTQCACDVGSGMGS
jgi:hypothetical protein